MSADKSPSPDERLQQEFNRWADAGEGEKMERHHLDITEKTMRLMDLRSGERVLDMGCGSGWATRLLARMVGEGPQGFGQVVRFRERNVCRGLSRADSVGGKLLR